MIYNNIKVTPNKSKSFPKKSTALLSFIFDGKEAGKEFDKLTSTNGVKTGSFDKKYFLDEKSNEISLNNPSSAPDLMIICKLKKDKITGDSFRNYLSGLIPKLFEKKIEHLVVDIPSYTLVADKFLSVERYYESVIEGIFLGNYSFDKFKSEKKKQLALTVLLNSQDDVKLAQLISKTENLITSVYFTRDLVNEPANVLTPLELVNRAKKELTKSGIKVTALNKTQLQKNKMNAILAVGGASDNHPYLLTLHYKPKQKAKKKIALVGKGVTYDSGGLSIKPTAGMLEMKADMAGAAAVIGTILSAAKNNIPVELFGVIPAVENMISGSSYKPGDVITAYSGKTIEVKDTDAEGRIVLADALHYASKLKPDHIIDFATLTGAVAVALGLFTAGVFTKSDELCKSIIEAGSAVNEPIWRMPFSDDFNNLLESDIADISNLGPRWGGAITAGKFLEAFVDEKIPYAHIDLAGPALKHKFTNYTEKYDTGYGVRLMYEYLRNIQ